MIKVDIHGSAEISLLEVERGLIEVADVTFITLLGELAMEWRMCLEWKPFSDRPDCPYHANRIAAVAKST